MTIDEAIEHFVWCTEHSCGECADEHRQLAEWLKELVALRTKNTKLCELARRAHGCKTDDGCCEDCWGDYGECPIEAEMRELGIEV